MVGTRGTRRSKEGVVTNALNAAVLITPSMEGAAQNAPAARSFFLFLFLREVTLRDISYACMQASLDRAYGAKVRAAWLLQDIRQNI